jgi:NitT/TauT family transport system permease protein
MKQGKKPLPWNGLQGVLSVLLLWYALHLLLQSHIVPAPLSTLLRFFRLLPGPLLPHLAASFGRTAAAVVLSLFAGGSLGLWMGVHPRVDRLLSPMVYLLYPIPKIAFLPVFMILFGLGDAAKVLLMTAIIFFQILIPVRDSIRAIPPGYILSAKALGMGRMQQYRHLFLPAVLPQLISALRIGTGTALAVLFIAENFATTYGIGYYIVSRWAISHFVEMYCGILALGLLGYLLYVFYDILETASCPWKNNRQGFRV